MLDEMREYELYTFELDKPPFKKEEFRLRKRTLVDNNLSGLSRAMEIIARKHLFPEGKRWDPSFKRIHEVQNILKRWCGDRLPPDSPDPEPRRLDGWLPGYVSLLCREFGVADKKREKTLEKLEERVNDEDGLKASVFSDSGYRNDQNRITYDGAIAEAIRKGPLKSRLLVGDSAKLGEIRIPGAKNRFSSANYKRVRVLTATFLLQETYCQYSRGEGYALIEPDRIQDWLGQDGNFKKGDYLKWEYRGKPLFGAISLGESNTMWHIAEDWLDDGRWELIEKGDANAIEKARKSIPNCTFYCDAMPDKLPVQDEGVGEMEMRSMFAEREKARTAGTR